MANLVAMLRLPSNLKSTQWQILAGPILILLILLLFGGGNFYGGGRFRGPGFGLGGLLLIILIVLLVTHRI